MTSFTMRALFLTASAAAAGVLAAPLAAADDGQTTLGGTVDVVSGDSVQRWTVGNLQPSADQLPYAPTGSLWEATATGQAVQGGIPVVPGFAARTADGQDYPVMWNVPTPLGINPAPLPAGGTASGKLYFDVTGAAPTGLAFSGGDRDLAVWVTPPPMGAGTGAATPAVRPWPATAPAPYPAAPAVVGQGVPSSGVAAAAGSSQGAPAATGSQGTPAAIPAGPAPAVGSQGTPAALAVPSAAAGSQGTPAGTPSTAAAAPAPSTTPAAAPVPAAPSPAPAPSGSPTTTVVPQGSSGTPRT